MKFLFRAALVSLMPLCLLHAQDAGKGAKKPDATGKKPDAATATADKQPEGGMLPYVQEFSNLPKEKREEFGKALGEAQRLFGQKRVFECLTKLDEAEKVFSNSPELLNLRGACQVEFRAFDKAMECYAKADRLAPNQASIVFNIGELKFVTKDWKGCIETFDKALKMIGDDPKQLQLARLVEFKILLSKIKLGDLAGAKKLAEKYDFLDDSPYPYYAEAALAYDAKKDIDAEAALARANRIFQDPNLLSPWQDTLIEYGYIKGFFGGDLEAGAPEAGH